MKLGVATLLAAGFLAACATPQPKVAASKTATPPAATNPWLLPQYDEHPLETERAAKDLGEQLARACLTDSLVAYPKGLPPEISPEGAIEGCARRKLSNLVGDPAGDKVCGSRSDFDGFFKCMMIGAMISHFRAQAGGPQQLTEAEWRNNELAKQNLISEIVVQAYAKCTTGDAAAIQRCQFRTVSSSLGLPAADVTYCESRANYMMSCLADKSVAKFVRDVAMRLWD